MSNTYSVYRHTFPNGKVYIGITMMEPKRRWSGGSGYRHQPKIYNAILYYGWKNVKHDILYIGLTKSEAEAIEIRLIAEYDSTRKGYNVEHGGNTTGTHSEETKQKISAGNKGKNTGKTWSDERKRDYGQRYSGVNSSMYGKHHSEKVKAEHSAFMKGNQNAKGLKHTDEFKAWKSKQMHEKYKDGGNPRCKRVIGIDEYGNEVEYASLRIAAKAIGVCPSTMYKYVAEDRPFNGVCWNYSEQE